VINKLMRRTGTVLLPVAAWLICVRGADYGRCAGLPFTNVPPHCQEAAAPCSLGIVLAMTGGLLNALSLIPARPLPPARRQGHDSASRIDQYLMAPYFPDLPI
jgi:hypothetical protein